MSPTAAVCGSGDPPTTSAPAHNECARPQRGAGTPILALTGTGHFLTVRITMLGNLGRFPLCVLVVAVLALLAASLTAEETTPVDTPVPTPQVGVLLLRNGQVIKGKISKAGRFYYVAFSHGEIRLKDSEVEFWCRDLEEGYRRKRAKIQPGNARDHLLMAQWCLRHGLLGHAAAELADAMDADPTHPMIAVLERRLRLAMEPSQATSPLAQPVAESPSADDLDRLVGNMPAGVVRTFTEAIQPVLANNCATAGCHGPLTDAEFRLLRIPKGRPPSRRTTQRNLYATLQWVDRQDPAASRLLTAAMQPHGSAQAAVFDKHQMLQYKRIADWVHRVAGDSQQEMPATPGLLRDEAADARPISTDPTNPFAPSDPLGGKVAPASHQEPAGKASKTVEANPLPVRPKIQRGAKLKQFVPADPFDPEIFNRRYSRRSNPTGKPNCRAGAEK